MKKIIYLLGCFSVLMLTQGCEEFLQEEPKGFASSENLLTSETGITQALNGVYRAGHGFYINRWYVMMYGISTDDIFFRKSRADRVAIQNYTFTPENGNLARAWTANVTGIARANQIIEAIQEFPDSEFKSQIEAEARFLRAWYYFGQVRTYGEVPLLTTFTGVELFPGKAPVPAIYTQIIEDLQFAESNLPNWMETSTGRATSGAAKSLLAKVYLTMATTPETADQNLFATAASKLEEVINREGYGLHDDYKVVFESQNSHGKEDVWSYPGQIGTDFRNSVSADFSPNPNLFGTRGFQNFTVFESGREILEEGDRRREIMVQGEYDYNVYDASGSLVSTEVGQTSDGGTAIYTTKYLDPDHSRFTSNDIGTNLPFIRYADVLLMYAEALNESQGSPSSEAYFGIDEVRRRAGASELPRGLSQSAFRTAVRDERRVEFLGEGMRWFDLVRWGILAEKVLEVKPSAQVSWPKHRYFPLPQFEVDANTNLDQNPDYVN